MLKCWTQGNVRRISLDVKSRYLEETDRSLTQNMVMWDWCSVGLFHTLLRNARYGGLEMPCVGDPCFYTPRRVFGKGEEHGRR